MSAISLALALALSVFTVPLDGVAHALRAVEFIAGAAPAG
jgi:hypothetical protein